MQEAHGARMHINDFTGKRVHMIGIGGSSMSGLAGLLARRGFAVTGSDNYDSYHVQAVRESGIPVTIGIAENVHGAALVSIPPPSPRTTLSVKKRPALASRRWSAPRCWGS